MSTAPLPASFKKLGLTRWGDVALHFPLRYENESQVWRLEQVVPGQFAQVQVSVIKARVLFRPRRMLLVDVEDDTGRALLRFIHFKDAQKNAFVPGAQIRVLGETRQSLGGVEFIHPRIRSGWLTEASLTAQPLMPVYPTTAGLSQITLRRAVARALQTDMPTEWLPASFLLEHKLMPLPQAVQFIHTPPADAQASGLMAELSAQQGSAWNRIRVDELLAQQLALRRARRLRGKEHAVPLKGTQQATAFEHQLPFQLTGAQQRVWAEISRDLSRDTPMQRLLQGDVGSGKTVIAALAAMQAVGSRLQVAIMAPTEILAEQLHKKFLEWLTPLQVTVALLKGGLPVAERRKLLAAIAAAEVSVVVGTHALIQKGVAFKCLGLVVVDEQHRFGVGQRLALRVAQSHEADVVPHLLGMSATPIPRSLAMTYLADLDVSVLDERPPNRKPVLTKLMSSARREELIERLQVFMQGGGQAYWVCPVIEQSTDEEARALQALETSEQWLAPIFGDQLAVVHGRMSTEEKSRVMQAFASGERRLLLATTVIEVGVDVPKASLMVIEHAERFGLAQLHQLRGRVGRGADQSTCILLFEEPLSDLAKARLKTLYETEDGFEVARRDLALRGPGEFLGLRQSGIPTLKYSDLERDAQWVELAVSFGAQLSAAERSATQLKAMGIARVGLDALVDRWAHEKAILLSSG